MNILFFTRRFCPLIGGVETHVLQLSKQLASKGWKVIVVTEKSESKLLEFEIVEGIDVYRISVGADDWFKKFRIWAEVWKLRNVITKADVIHCHDVFFWYLPFRFLLWNKPVYTTFHGYETVYPPAKKAIFVRKLSEKLSRGTICVGDFIKKWYGTKADYITYGGVDSKSNVIPDLIGDRDKLDSSTPVKQAGSFTVFSPPLRGNDMRLKIIFVGRLEKDIGSTIYLKVLDILKSDNIAYNLHVYGDGSEKNHFAQYGKVHGFTKDLDEAITSADIVFVSSYLSILQAMAHKKLVMAVYDNPLKEDYLKMAPFAAWIVIEEDPEKVAEKIVYYVEHPKEKEKMIEKAYAWSLKQSWENVADGYRTLWKNK